MIQKCVTLLGALQDQGSPLCYRTNTLSLFRALLSPGTCREAFAMCQEQVEAFYVY